MNPSLYSSYIRRIVAFQVLEEYEVWADKGLHVAVEESVGRREESAQVWHHKRLGVIMGLFKTKYLDRYEYLNIKYSTIKSNGPDL